MAGYKECPKFLKDAYLRAVKECQICKKEKQLEIHRIIRGNDGGLYTVCKLNKKGSNVMVICNTCHKMLHENETSHVSNSY